MLSWAGELRVAPHDFAFFEIQEMVKALRLAEWDHTASILAVIVNVNRNPKKTKAIGPEKFHPYRKPAHRVMTREEFRARFRGKTQVVQ